MLFASGIEEYGHSAWPHHQEVFASILPEQLFELKNEDAIKKSKNLSGTCPWSAIHQHYAWPDLIS